MELYYPILMDGATGTELQKRGYTGDVCTEQWVLENPEVLQELQRGYIDAGSQIIYAPTFGANRVKLEENKIFNKVSEYNRKLVAISKEAADGRALVAGDMSPTGKFLAPVGDMRFEELYDIYREQAEALEEAGVDLYIIETVMAVSDARAAVLAVRSVSSKPILVSFTCDESGRTVTGSDILAVMTIMQHMDIQAFGMNCSVGPKEMLNQVRRIRPYAEVPLIAKPNAGFPEIIDGKTVYDCPADDFCSEIENLAASGVGIFGGCCGTDASHIQTIAAKLANVDFVAPESAVSDKIICATEKEMFELDPAAIQFGDAIPCNDDLADALENLADDQQIITLAITSEDQLENLADYQHMIDRPLALAVEDADLLDQALAIYQGRALYAGGLPEEALVPLARKYGVIF